jgi:phage terminase large subunit-like protein
VPPPSTTSSRRGRTGGDGWPPRWLTPVPAADLNRGDGDDACGFIEAVCRVTKDSVAAPAGRLLRLRDWQRELCRHIYARRPDGRLRHRQVLVGVARKNGKSALSAGLGLYDLMMGPQGGEVYSCAADREQARIVFGTARRMVELDPELPNYLTLYRDVIEFKKTGSIYRVLSAEAFTKEGLNPHKVLFDEVHAQPNRELWDVMALAMGARPEPQMIGITTAGVRADSSGQDSLCYGLYQYGKRIAAGEINDASFFMAWWEPALADSDHRSPDTWREANPGFADLVDPEDFTSSVLRTPEPEFRTKRCNQWVSTAATWLPHGAWARCAEKRQIPDLAEVVLGFDGSFSNDSTALVAVQTGEVPHVDVVACWEIPVGADPSWRVPIADVEEAIRQACRRWKVREIVCDPFRWARTYQQLEAEGLPIVEFPQSPQRMVPATQRFYEAVLNGGLTHSGDPRLARHVDNAVLKVDARGSRLAKDTRNSPRKIDLAVAAVMAFDRASEQPPPSSEPAFAFADW